MLGQGIINTVNYYVQSLYLYDFTYRASGYKADYRKGLLLYCALVATPFIIFDLLITPLPPHLKLIVKVIFHIGFMSGFTCIYLKQKPGYALIINLFMAFICGLMEIVAVLILGAMYPVKVDDLTAQPPIQFIMTVGFIDLMEFIALRLTNLVDRRRDHDVNLGFQFLIAICLLFYILAFGSISRITGNDGSTISTVVRILITVTWVLMNLSIYLFVRHIRRINSLIETGDRYARFNRDIGAQDEYFLETNEELRGLQRRILQYRSEFPEGSTADSIYHEFRHYTESRFTENPILDALLQHYDALYNEKSISRIINIRTNIEKYMDNYTAVTLFSYILDQLMNHNDINITASDSCGILSINISYRGRPSFSKRKLNLINRLISDLPHEVNQTSCKNQTELKILIELK